MTQVIEDIYEVIKLGLPHLKHQITQLSIIKVSICALKALAQILGAKGLELTCRSSDSVTPAGLQVGGHWRWVGSLTHQDRHSPSVKLK